MLDGGARKHSPMVCSSEPRYQLNRLIPQKVMERMAAKKLMLIAQLYPEEVLAALEEECENKENETRSFDAPSH